MAHVSISTNKPGLALAFCTACLGAAFAGDSARADGSGGDDRTIVANREEGFQAVFGRDWGAALVADLSGACDPLRAIDDVEPGVSAMVMSDIDSTVYHTGTCEFPCDVPQINALIAECKSQTGADTCVPVAAVVGDTAYVLAIDDTLTDLSVACDG